jgi:hypothetical protein
LFRMGERELYDNDKRLTTPELLAFIVEHPEPRDYLIAFAFDYDTSNILRDLPEERLRWLLGRDNQHRTQPAQNAFTHYGGYTWHRFPGGPTYGVQYMPRNYLRVCVAMPVAMPDRSIRWAANPATVRTIHDAFGNFQTSFLKALADWNIGADHREAINAMKAARSDFTRITPAIRDYCAIECRLLADMMENFRSACLASEIWPASWNGAGKLAAALMKHHGVIRRKEVERRCPIGVLKMAHAAYYGGRFEVTRCGLIEREVNAFDIRSAYPDAMQSLPCLQHGRWHTASGPELHAKLKDSDALFVGAVHFQHPRGSFLCGLPWRSKDSGAISWPRLGAGVYWSPEIRSAQALGATVQLFDGWLFEKRCDCVPMPWLEQRYEQRRELDKLGAGRGKPLKLAYNAVYGKTAQRRGSPPYANPIYAGLATAFTRAKLNRAIVAAGPRNVIMIATDAIYTVGKLPRLDIGTKLGQWEHTPHPSLFIVRPGLYWPPKPRDKAWKLKTRGVSEKFLVKKIPRFRAAWRAYWKRRHTSPIVKVKMDTFIGLRLALHLNKPELACQWIERTMHLTFECASTNKRGARRWLGKSIIMGPLDGHPTRASHVYKPDQLLTTGEPWEEERLWLEAMPDPIDLGPPHID